MFVVPLTAAKRGGTIECRELATYPAGAVYKCQPKAWFSEDIMLEWVSDVLAPYVATQSPKQRDATLWDGSSPVRKTSLWRRAATRGARPALRIFLTKGWGAFASLCY